MHSIKRNVERYALPAITHLRQRQHERPNDAAAHQQRRRGGAQRVAQALRRRELQNHAARRVERVHNCVDRGACRGARGARADVAKDD